ncbi:type IV pilin-like G/H family protein [Trichothermofontia sp.]
MHPVVAKWLTATLSTAQLLTAKLSRSRWHRLTPLQMWGGMVLVLGCLGGGVGNIPQTWAKEPAPTANLAEETTAEPITQAILGRWQTQNPDMTLVFAPEGKLFLLLNTDTEVKLAEELRYHLNPDTQPMQIDLTLNQGETIATIFELMPVSTASPQENRQLRLELTHIAPGDERPTAFSDRVLVFQQTSRSTTPPQATTIQGFEQRQTQAREREAQLYMGALAQAQAAFYQRYGKFAATLEEFVAGLEPETAFYRYRVVPAANPRLGVTLMAQAKTSGLRSFTSLVFANLGSTPPQIGSTLCQSTRPSTIPPTLLVQMPVQDPQQVRCPLGAQAIH